jgi:hypothetical protein
LRANRGARAPSRKQLPGFDFDRVWKTKADDHEVRRSNDQGNVREVKVTGSRKVVEID